MRFATAADAAAASISTIEATLELPPPMVLKSASYYRKVLSNAYLISREVVIDVLTLSSAENFSSDPSRREGQRILVDEDSKRKSDNSNVAEVHVVKFDQMTASGIGNSQLFLPCSIHSLPHSVGVRHSAAGNNDCARDVEFTGLLLQQQAHVLATGSAEMSGFDDDADFTSIFDGSW